MRSKMLGFIIALLVLGATGSNSIATGSRGLDEAIHNAGNILLPVTNYGVYGAPEGDRASFRWPGPDGIDHLRMGALWVGARKFGIPRVTCGANAVETPLEFKSGAPEWGSDTYLIYETSEAYSHGDRYPYSDGDDDGDGLEDEDPYDGLDNDSDGQNGEDGATISDQMLTCFYRDYLPECYDDSPYHEDLHLHVQQETYQWSMEPFRDFIGIRYSITYSWSTLEDIYLGWYADWNILLDSDQGDIGDDQVGRYQGRVQIESGERFDVDIVYAFDESADRASYAGIVVLDHPTDSEGILAPTSVGMRNLRVITPDLPFEDGGEPTNDEQMYALLDAEQSTAVPDSTADFRTLISCGPFQAQYHDTLTWQLALVAGASEPELLNNAAMAMWLYAGKAFDRDGDPETGPDGLEHVVHWWPHDILTQAVPTPMDGLNASNHPNPFNPATEIRFVMPEPARVNLVVFDLAGRRCRTLLSDVAYPGGDARVMWDGRDDSGQLVPGGVYFYEIKAGEYRATRKMTLLK